MNAPEKASVKQMFDEISSSYDLLNHLLSLGIDFTWRKRVVNEIRKRYSWEYQPVNVLDVATGTGDLALAIAKPANFFVTGIDLAEGMLEMARKKLRSRPTPNPVFFLSGDAEQLRYPDHHFDVVTVAFGVRNFENLTQGLSEMRRVLKPGGLMLILEFSHPEKILLKHLYQGYSRYIIPFLGKMISKHSRAYHYLPESVSKFPSGNEFLEILNAIGMNRPVQIRLTGGIASIYRGEK